MQNLCAVRSSASNIDPVIICIIRMSVPKCQVIGDPSFCLVAFGVVPGWRCTEGLKMASPTKADLIYHTTIALFCIFSIYTNLHKWCLGLQRNCLTVRVGDLEWSFLPESDIFFGSFRLCFFESLVVAARNMPKIWQFDAEVPWFMRLFNRIVCTHFYFFVRRRKWW